MSNNWGYKGIFPNSAPSSPNFYGYRGIKSFAGNPFPAVTLTPSEETVKTGNTLTITAHATNTIAYVWQESTDNVNWTEITGETDNEITLSYPHESGTAGIYYYRVICYGLLGYTISTSAKITVEYSEATVVIAAEKTDVAIPGSVNFLAFVEYVSMIQWQHSDDGETWTDIIGETNAYFTANFVSGDAGEHYYRCVATGLSGTAVSEAVKITVTE